MVENQQRLDQLNNRLLLSQVRCRPASLRRPLYAAAE